MGTSAAIAILLAAAQISATIPAKDKQQQEQVFQSHWQTDFEWQFENLPEKGSVPGHQMPYSGYIYPDKQGGTKSIMAMYDRAFHYGRSPAATFEDWDTKAYKTDVDVRGPLFGLKWGKKNDVPAWSGHCNGWAAAAIRHAEPQQSVRRNGVVFEPSDIKGLLAELYIYNDIADLSGSGDDMNAGLFHVVITNWLGRANHAVAMEADPGEEKWNYPVYAFSSDSAQRSPRHVEVKVNLGYLKDSNGEYEESPKINRVKYFHYVLELDAMGKIVGGRFYQDSALIDMLWLPLQPKPGRQPGNKAGNPYLNVNDVLAIWRDSVPEDVRNKWIVIDPPTADSRLVLEKDRELLPVGYSVIRPNPPVHVEVEVAQTDETPSTDSIATAEPTTEPAIESLASDDVTTSAAPSQEPLVVESMILTEADDASEPEAEVATQTELTAPANEIHTDPLDDLFRDLPAEPAAETAIERVSDSEQEPLVVTDSLILTEQGEEIYAEEDN